jgi:hypothetical protein
MSQLEVDKIIPQSGTTLTLGDTGDTINFGSGVLPNFENLTVTGDLTVDTNSLKVDSANNRVGIGTASPSVALDVVGAITASGNITGTLATAAQPNITSVGTLTSFASTGIDDNATSTAMTIDSSERVGIGTSSPSTKLHVSGGTVNTVSLIESTDAFAWLSIKDNSSANSYINSIGASGDNLQIISKDITFRTASAPNVSTATYGSERMRIDSSGNLLVGKTSDSFAGEGLVFSPGSASSITRDDGNVISIRRDTSDGDIIKLYKDTTTVGVIGTQNWGIGTSSPAAPLHIDTNTADANNPFVNFDNNDGNIGQIRMSSSGDFGFRANTGGTGVMFFQTGGSSEAMRITSSGNIGIGDTAPQDFVEINGSGRGLGGLTISNSSHANAALSFARSLAATARIHTTEPGAASTSDLRFQTSDGSGGAPNLVTAMVINQNQNVGIGTTSPSARLETKNATDGSTFAFQATNDNDHEIVQIGAQSDGDGYLTVHGQGASTNIKVQLHSDGDSYFTGGNVGIGTSSPASTLEISKSDRDNGCTLSISNAHTGTDWEAGDIIGTINFRTDDTSTTEPIRGQVVVFDDASGASSGAPNNTAMKFSTALNDTLSERMRIASDGNVGIGTSSPGSELHIVADNVSESWSAYDGTVLTIENNDNDGCILQTVGRNTATNEIWFGDDDSRNIGRIRYEHSDNVLEFWTNTSERMRIDSSGNVLVGTTNVLSSSNTTDSGCMLTSSHGWITNNNASALRLQRLTSDGLIQTFYRSGALGGALSIKGGDFIIHSYVSGHCGLRFTDEPAMLPTDNTGDISNGSMDIGRSSNKFQDIFATNGTIQTSDQNEKQSIQSLTTAEMNVAKRLSPLIKTFKWNSAVEEKGDNARTHIGIIAQNVQQSFTDEGLDANNYALFCSDTWWEKEIFVEATEEQDAHTYIDYKEEATDGYTERTRLGVRYPQLLSFIQAYNDQRFNELEARITTLENA